MSATIIDGAALAKKIKKDIAEQIKAEKIEASLAVIIVGDNPASKIYVRNKRTDCDECGIHSLEFALDAETSEEELLQLIDSLNIRDDISGILVQLPLPGHISEDKVISRIYPKKDVDCFHPYNVGLLMTGNANFLPCTPAGVIAMLDEYGIDPEGKHCVVIGRSNIVGKPMALLLLSRNGTVTICHSKTPNLKEIVSEADILISAVGKKKLVTDDMIKEGAVVIDVAMNRKENGKLCGDVDFDSVKERASYITPVPGGVGPMTRAMLMKNTLKAALYNK